MTALKTGQLRANPDFQLRGGCSWGHEPGAKYLCYADQIQSSLAWAPNLGAGSNAAKGQAGKYKGRESDPGPKGMAGSMAWKGLPPQPKDGGHHSSPSKRECRAAGPLLPDA